MGQDELDQLVEGGRGLATGAGAVEHGLQPERKTDTKE